MSFNLKMQTNKKTKISSKGFTLIELVITICIIAIFTELVILYIIAKLVELAIFGGIYLFIYYPSASSLILDSNLSRLARLIIIFLFLFVMFLWYDLALDSLFSHVLINYIIKLYYIYYLILN